MTTLEDSLYIQRTKGILIPPTEGTVSVQSVNSTPSTFTVDLVNNSSSSNVYAVISGLALDKGSQLILVKSDASTAYYPPQPADIQTPLTADVNIPLGAPGTTKKVTFPHMAGGRIWFCIGEKLEFRLNPGGNGAALVEPSVNNKSDPNYNKDWTFCEFTYNNAQLFGNVTFVDFVGKPLSFKLVDTNGNTQIVEGIPADGAEQVASKLEAQNAKDGAGWDKLVIRNGNGVLRVLNPSKALALFPGLLSGYFDGYVDQVWDKYRSETLTVNTQAFGDKTGQVSGNTFNFSDGSAIGKPTTEQIFACDGGAFANVGTPVHKNIVARLGAAFNRTTLLANSEVPNGAQVSEFYTRDPTNHYGRVVHEVEKDNIGYTFAYDDVHPSRPGTNQAGTVNSGIPQTWEIVFGDAGSSTVSARGMTARGRQQVGRPAHARVRRDLSGWASAAEEKAQLALADFTARPAAVDSVDLEAGNTKVETAADFSAPASVMTRPVGTLVPSGMQARVERLVERLEDSPVYQRLRPAFELFARLLLAFMSLSLRAIISRAAMVLFFLVFYFFAGPLAKNVDASGQAADVNAAVVEATRVDGGAVLNTTAGGLFVQQ